MSALATNPSEGTYPIGKYKGTPTLVVLEDGSYCEFMLAQPWFEKAQPTIFKLMNQRWGSTAEDSSEHNEMQVAYLEDEHCIALARVLFPGIDDAVAPTYQSQKDRDKWMSTYKRLSTLAELHTDQPKLIDPPKTENGGWDVTFQFSPSMFRAVVLAKEDDCGCKPCGHGKCKRYYGCAVADPRSQRRTTNDDGHAEGCVWRRGDDSEWLRYPNDFAPASRSVAVELKPDLGDDYPSVLRQVKARWFRNRVQQAPTYTCVVTRRAAFRSVTLEQVRRQFANEGIVLMMESEMLAGPRAAIDAVPDASALKTVKQAIEFAKKPSREEAADVLICLFGWAELNGLDGDAIVEAAHAKIRTNLARISTTGLPDSLKA